MVQSVGHGRRDVESHDEGAVVLCFEHLKQKLSGRLLLELEAGADGGAGVNHDADAQRKIDLLVKGVDLFRRLLVVEQGEVVLGQVGDVVSVLVGDREDEVDFVDADMKGRRAGVRIRPGPGNWRRGGPSSRLSGRLRRRLSCRLSCRIGRAGCRRGLLGKYNGRVERDRQGKRGKTPEPRRGGRLRRGKLCVHHFHSNNRRASCLAAGIDLSGTFVSRPRVRLWRKSEGRGLNLRRTRGG